MGKATDAGGIESNLYIFIVRTKFSELVWSTDEANQIKNSEKIKNRKRPVYWE